MTEGTLVKWLKQEGDKVEISEVLAEVETDKATMEMEAFDEGTLKIYTPQGGTVPVGTAIAFIAGDGEEAPAAPEASPPQPAPTAATPSPEPAPQESPFTPAEPAAATTPPPLPAAPTPSVPTSSGGPLRASPVALKLAAAQGVDLSAIAGSGPGGRIVKNDVLAYLAGGAAPAPVAAPAQAPATQATPAPAPVQPAPRTIPAPRQPASSGDQRIPLTGMRATVAERLLASKTQIPHFYLHLEIDAAPLMTLRKQLNTPAEADETGNTNKYTVNDFVLKAAVAAAVAVPEANASFEGDAIVRYASVNLSVAIALEEGLVTPVIRDAQNLNLLQISQQVKDLAAKARNKRLSPDTFSGGTLTTSNLGAYGIESFDAIINPPQAAILSIGAIVKKPVLSADGNVVPGLRMDIGMSCDHRVIDGAIGARYLSELKKILEAPAMMLV